MKKQNWFWVLAAAVAALYLLGVPVSFGLALVILVGVASIVAEYIEPGSALKRYIKKAKRIILAIAVVLVTVQAVNAVLLLPFKEVVSTVFHDGKASQQEINLEILLVIIAGVAGYFTVYGGRKAGKWRRGLGVAALFVFVLGLYQSKGGDIKERLASTTIGQYVTAKSDAAKAATEMATADQKSANALKWGVASKEAILYETVYGETGPMSIGAVKVGETVMRLSDRPKAVNGLPYVEVRLKNEGGGFTNGRIGWVESILFEWTKFQPSGLAQAESTKEEARKKVSSLPPALPVAKPAGVKSITLPAVEEKLVKFSSDGETRTGILVAKGDQVVFSSPSAPFKFLRGDGGGYRTFNGDIAVDIKINGEITVDGAGQDGQVLVRAIHRGRNS